MGETGETACIVMAKWPEPGRVKTRLARSLGDEAAARLARAMLLDTLDRVRARGMALRLALDGPAGPFPEEFEGFSVEPQEGKDLGERVARAVAARWLEGFEDAIVVGTDSPDLPDHFLAEAADALRRGVPSVLGPTADGGLYLLGFRRDADPGGEALRHALTGLSWGSERIFAEVRDALAPPLGPPRTLGPWYDVDEPPDLDRLARSAGAPERIRRWLANYGFLAI